MVKCEHMREGESVCTCHSSDQVVEDGEDVIDIHQVLGLQTRSVQNTDCCHDVRHSCRVND